MVEWVITQADVIDGLRALPDGCAQTVVTSPPYYGLRDYGVSGQLGLEANPDCLGWATGQACGECYICHMVAVFGEVWRVLRDDGTVWLNIGDSYNGYPGNGISDKAKSLDKDRQQARHKKPAGYGLAAKGLKQKDMMMIPARLALALQAFSWYVRSDIAWAKKNGMPESVEDRPSRAWEHIFLLTKARRYYYDHIPVRESFVDKRKGRDGGKKPPEIDPSANGGRNLRDVWLLATTPYEGAHFAVFPTEIPERCIKAGTSEKGQCPTCGAPWRRVVEKPKQNRNAETDSAYQDGSSAKRLALLRQAARAKGSEYQNETRTVGWQPGCMCGGDPIPQLVLDPFCGAATTGLMAHRLGRRFHGIELNPEYVALGRRRILDDQGAQPEQLTEDDQDVQLRFDL